MLSNIWHFLLTKPLLNILALLIAFIPGGDVGLAVIALTILVKLAILPITKKSIESQAEMMKIQPELEKIKKSGGNQEEQARRTFELYKQYNVNPFSGCLLALIQIPIILALYLTFDKEINFTTDLLYSFVQVPENMNMIFLGLINISEKSLILAIIAGITQYLQALFMPKPIFSSEKNSVPSFQESLSKSMHVQMKYMFPFLIGFVSYTTGAVALYFITSNIFGVFQQIYIDKKRKDLAIKI